MSAAIVPPSFQWSFLLPKYWPVWFGAGLLYVISWLPFPVIRKLGNGVGYLLGKLAKKRVHVARRNLQLTYPDWTDDQVEVVVQKNLQRAGMALFETVMGWWWPEWRIKRVCEVEGYEHAKKILDSGKGVFGLALHNMNLELGCRLIGYTHPSIAFYRKHNNPLMDYFQYHGRNRSNKYMIHKRNAKALIKAMDEGELCLYLPDQDYGSWQSIFVPFGGVEKTATTTATLMFARKTNSAPVMITTQYSKKGCKLKFLPLPENMFEQDDEVALTQLNDYVLKTISEQPESYLWMHKRFKSRPNEGDPSLY